MATKKTSKSNTAKASKDNKDESRSDFDDKSKQHKQKNTNIKLNKKTIYISASIIILMLSLSFLLFDQDTDDNISPPPRYDVYNGYIFNELEGVENVWETTIKLNGKDQRIELRYHPLELEEYSYDNETDQYFFLTQRADGNVTIAISDEIYHLSSNYVTLASYDVARVLRSFLGYDLQVSVENDDTYEWIDCNNASIDNLVVKMMVGEPRIESDNFCVRLYFDEPIDSLKISSLLIYNLLGIME